MTTKMTLMSVVLLLAVVSMTTGFQQPQFQQQQLAKGANNNANANAKSSIGGVNARLLATQQQQQQQQQQSAQTILSAATTASDDEDRVLDTEAIAKYAGAVATQMILFKGFFTGVDLLTSNLDVQVPFAANFAFFFVLALKSRIFNPMKNQRPRRDTKEIDEADASTDASIAVEPPRKMPEWTPPGIVFPIVWILVIGPLRAASSALLVTGGAEYASPAIMALMLHLSIGDTWNTVNNVERRYGTSVLGVACVWISAAFAAYSYGQVDPFAGQLLSLPVVWLTIASSLIVRTWQLNPSPTSGEKESLLPTKPASQEGSITKLVWFEKSDDDDSEEA